MKFWRCIYLVGVLLLCKISSVTAGPLADRLEQFPNWQSKPSIQMAQGDLVYPDWMAGTWQVTSTLVDSVAPLAPVVVTPGFAENRRYLQQPVAFRVRFERKYVPRRKGLPIPTLIVDVPVVADRAFNGLKIAEAYLGDGGVLRVKVDPSNPNRQVTFLPGSQLVSTVTGRGSETAALNQFVATEVCQQEFRTNTQIYLNEVETTTAYQLTNSGTIEADQVSAVYLSPQDPNFFKAAGRPVALYRYQLELLPVEEDRKTDSSRLSMDDGLGD